MENRKREWKAKGKESEEGAISEVSEKNSSR
jgi:hypothetical protein